MTSDGAVRPDGAATEALPRLRIPVEDAFAGLVGAARKAGRGGSEKLGAMLGAIDWSANVGGLSLWALRLRAQRGAVSAQRELGYRLANGDGASSDVDEAFQWFRRGAKQGDVACQYALGVMYANGQGVPEGKLQAAVWYQKAAEQGHPAAQFNLALLYDAGEGVARDSEKAFHWYLKAAEQSYVRAQFNLGIVYESGDGRDPDPVLALDYYTRAAEQGFVAAQLRVAAACLENGRAVDAWVWYAVAARSLPAGEELDLAEQGREAALQRMSLAEIEAARQRLRARQS